MRIVVNYRVVLDVPNYQTAGIELDRIQRSLDAQKIKGAPFSFDLGKDCGTHIGYDEPRAMRDDEPESPFEIVHEGRGW